MKNEIIITKILFVISVPLVVLLEVGSITLIGSVSDLDFVIKYDDIFSYKGVLFVYGFMSIFLVAMGLDFFKNIKNKWIISFFIISIRFIVIYSMLYYMFSHTLS